MYLEDGHRDKDEGLEYRAGEDAVVVAVVGLAVQVQAVAVAPLLQLDLRDALVQLAQRAQRLLQAGSIDLFSLLLVLGAHFEGYGLRGGNGANIQLREKWETQFVEPGEAKFDVLLTCTTFDIKRELRLSRQMAYVPAFSGLKSVV